MILPTVCANRGSGKPQTRPHCDAAFRPSNNNNAPRSRSHHETIDSFSVRQH